MLEEEEHVETPDEDALDERVAPLLRDHSHTWGKIAGCPSRSRTLGGLTLPILRRLMGNWKNWLNKWAK